MIGFSCQSKGRRQNGNFHGHMFSGLASHGCQTGFCRLLFGRKGLCHADTRYIETCIYNGRKLARIPHPARRIPSAVHVWRTPFLHKGTGKARDYAFRKRGLIGSILLFLHLYADPLPLFPPLCTSVGNETLPSFSDMGLM